MLDTKARALAEGKNFAVLTTLMPDGSAQSHVIWIDTDGDHLIFNTEIHRQKFKNLERDPRVTVTVIDAENPYSFVEVRGRVAETVRGEVARSHIDQLARKYLDKDYPGVVKSERVMIKVAPDLQVVH